MRRPTKLDAYHGIIGERLATWPELSAVRLFEEVRAAGYSGGITQLRDFVARVRPRPEPEPAIRFETAPGQQAQVDFAMFKFPWGTRYALLLVLGYSRLLWLRFYPRQTLATVIGGLEEAFAYLGGVPREVLFDQMKAVVLEDHRTEGCNPAASPGTRFEYSNAGYTVLGVLLEKLYGKSYGAALHDEIAAPLGLTTFDQVRRTEAEPGGRLLARSRCETRPSTRHPSFPVDRRRRRLRNRGRSRAVDACAPQRPRAI